MSENEYNLITDFVSKLGRELTQSREEINQLKSQLTKTHGCVTISRNGYVQEIERELANIKDQRDVAVWVFEKCREDRTRVVAQRDRLADAMLEMWPFIEEDDFGSLNTPAFSAAIKKYKQALDDVKGDPR
jgi:ribosomal 50S subunit-associated protein YjgA (DUF615 family)